MLRTLGKTITAVVQRCAVLFFDRLHGVYGLVQKWPSLLSVPIHTVTTVTSLALCRLIIFGVIFRITSFPYWFSLQLQTDELQWQLWLWRGCLGNLESNGTFDGLAPPNYKRPLNGSASATGKRISPCSISGIHGLFCPTSFQRSWQSERWILSWTELNW